MMERLPEPAGLLLDRSETVAFSFEGRRYQGFRGDTVASALAANDVTVLSRSFKYHRPRGIHSLSGLDANTLVQVGPAPNRFADREPLAAGLEVMGQNYWGTLRHDRMAVFGLLHRFFPAGFYYKAFYKPRWTWPLWARMIRRIAGLGSVDTAAPHGYFDKQYLFCDVLVVGGGAAGLAAAAQAAAAGAEVVLADENAALGGALLHGRFDAGGVRTADTRTALADEVEADARISVMTETACLGWYADNWLPLVRGNRLYKLRAKALVVATGCLEQPLVFRNNDLPGVMLASAAQRLIKLYGVRPGRRAVVATASDDGYGAALDLLDAGVEVAALVDLRTDAPPQRRRRRARRPPGAGPRGRSTLGGRAPAQGPRHRSRAGGQDRGGRRLRPHRRQLHLRPPRRLRRPGAGSRAAAPGRRQPSPTTAGARRRGSTRCPPVSSPRAGWRARPASTG